MIIKSKFLVKIFSFNFAKAMALFPFVLINDEKLRKDECLINHEKIHLRQQLELLIVFFYLLYFFEYLIRRIKFKTHREAYFNISFEREAYANEENLNYLKNRPFLNFKKFL